MTETKTGEAALPQDYVPISTHTIPAENLAAKKARSSLDGMRACVRADAVAEAALRRRLRAPRRATALLAPRRRCRT